jgi:hypothetical protein
MAPISAFAIRSLAFFAESSVSYLIVIHVVIDVKTVTADSLQNFA